eukprot:scaffold8531_cov130-Isochrysis_galbana.AAC.2
MIHLDGRSVRQVRLALKVATAGQTITPRWLGKVVEPYDASSTTAATESALPHIEARTQASSQSDSPFE